MHYGASEKEERPPLILRGVKTGFPGYKPFLTLSATTRWWGGGRKVSGRGLKVRLTDGNCCRHGIKP